MQIFEIDPLSDTRWADLLDRSRHASIFHTRGWLEALARTYGYKPVVLTTCSPGRALTNGLVFCRVDSWLTGRRLVSVPFSDHCEALCETGEQLQQLLYRVQELSRAQGCKYAEIRPASELLDMPSEWHGHERYCLQRLDLRSGFKAVSRQFHPDCIQRRIRHAVREGIRIVDGRDSSLLDVFYQLLLATRRRHGLPPQPKAWFRNLVRCVGESATVYCAMKGDRAIAAILTLRYRRTTFYKYGASLSQFHRYGAMPYLIASAIKDAINRGDEEMDFGRSSYKDQSLIRFKARWGAVGFPISYLRAPAAAQRVASENVWLRRMTKSACQRMPERCLVALGSLSYRHIG